VTTGEDVVSDPETSKNYDYELSPEEANLPTGHLLNRVYAANPDMGSVVVPAGKGASHVPAFASSNLTLCALIA
jgi:hypothetical protein